MTIAHTQSLLIFVMLRESITVAEIRFQMSIEKNELSHLAIYVLKTAIKS